MLKMSPLTVYRLPMRRLVTCCYLMLVCCLVCWRFGDASFSLGVASFNVHHFDAARYDANPEIYAGIVGWQKIFLLQEVLNTSIAGALVDRLNRRTQYASKKPFRYITSQLLGPDSNDKQAYVFVYRKDYVTPQKVYQYPLQNYTQFYRPPFSVKFSSPVLGSFVCTGMHTKANQAVAELRALYGAVQHIQAVMESRDILIMGDMNVGCGLVKPEEWSTISLFSTRQFQWYVSQSSGTLLTSGCSDDRFIASRELALRIPESSVSVYHYESFYGLNKEQALQISTHYPIQLTIIQPEPSESIPVQTAITESELLKKYGYGADLGCGYITSSLQGALTDGSGLNVNYRNNLDCIWVILAPLNHSITIRIEYRFENFFEDRLDVRDGDDLSSRLLIRIQGNGSQVISTSGNVLLLNFVTDSSGTSEGFLATFTSSPICGATMTALEGSFSSPVNIYTQRYPDNAQCTWNIIVPLGKVIKLTFQYFDVEPDDRCAADFVVLANKAITSDIFQHVPMQERALEKSQNAATNTRLCGDVLPQPYTSSANNIGVGFSSDYTTGGKGFMVSYSATNRSSCHGGFHFSGHHGVFDDDSGPSANYGPNINCSYYITVPDNHIMSLKFLSLSIEPSPGCIFDYLNIWDVDAGRLLKQICGQIQPGIIVSSGQHIRLQLVTDASLQFTGFSVSYRACPKCPTGMFSSLPCFDLQGGFCAKCAECAADERIERPCTSISDTVCTKLSLPAEDLDRACLSDEYACNGGPCMPATILCDGTAQCPEGDDESNCGCDATTQFQCNNKKCIPQYLRCEGQDTCLDGSDEEDCTCDLQNEFTCTDGQNISGCIPLGWRCDGEADCISGIDEQGCLRSERVDPCSTQKLPELSTRPGVRLATFSWVQRCFNSIPLKPSVKNVTMNIIRNGVLGLYAYTDLLQDSTNTDSSLKPGVNYSIHRIAVNIQKELARIEATDYSSSYAFHRDISKLMGSFFDAHTTYVTPYTAIHFALPFIFGSAVVNGEQRLTVDRVSGGTFPAYYELHKGPPFINFDKFSSVFPQLLGLQPENLVTTINGIPAMNYTRSFADQAGTYKSAGARFNAFLSTPAYNLGQYPMPENDTIDIVFDDNTAIHVEYTAFISVPAGLTLRSLLTAEYDVKRLVKLAKDQKLFRQFLLSYSDDDNIPSALLAGVDTQRRRRRRRDTSPEFPKMLEIQLSYANSFFAFYDSGTVIVKMTTFAPPTRNLVGFVGFFNQVVELARRKETSTLLLDMSGNGGGYLALAHTLTAFLVPSWRSSPRTTICGPLDVRISSYLRTMSASLTSFRKQLAEPMTAAVAMQYVTLVRDTINGSLTQSPPDVTLQVVDSLASSMTAAMTDTERAAVLSSFFEMHVFSPIESLLLYGMQTPGNMATGAPLTLADLVSANTVTRKRGGVTDQYSQKFISLSFCVNVLEQQAVVSLMPSEPPFRSIAILTDGECGSACSQFTSLLQLSGKATVISYGGYTGEEMDGSAFAGGNVVDWNYNFWSTALSAALWTRLAQSDVGQTARLYGYAAPLPLPSQASTRFDFTESYMRGLGSNSLPREWYVIPANIHLNKWTSGTNTWPVTSSQEVALLNLYRTVLAEYQRGGGSVNTFQPCHFEVKCRPHAQSLWSSSTVTFVNTTLWRDSFTLYNNSQCAETGMEFQVVRYAQWQDRGPNNLSPTILAASKVRKLSVSAQQYIITPSSEKWMSILSVACPCYDTPPWTLGKGQTIRASTCLPDRCNFAPITFNTLYGNYALQDASHVYISDEVSSPKLAETEPINGDAIYVLDTVYKRCFPVVSHPSVAPPTADGIQEGQLRAITTYLDKWRHYQIYLGSSWQSLCADNWKPRDAIVFCRQETGGTPAGWSSGSSAALLNASLATAQVRVEFNCTGEEVGLIDCPRISVSSCSHDLLQIKCKRKHDSPTASSNSHQALDYGLGISFGMIGLSVILITVYLVRKARQKATKFSSDDIASMQLGQPKSWWRWTPLNETDDMDHDALAYSNQIDYAA